MKDLADKAGVFAAGGDCKFPVGFRIVLMGAPGAGKGTQASRMAESHGVPHISTGEIFRQHMEAGTALGKAVKACIDDGHLAPDDVACRIVDERLSQPDCMGGYILDGFPRSLNQAQCLEVMLEHRGEQLDHVINIDVNDDEIVRRLSARWMCPRCGAIYNKRFNPSRDGQTCDQPPCEGTELVQRLDDQEGTVRERLRVYHAVSEPILEFYEEKGVLENVPGAGMTPEEVFVTIEDLVRTPTPGNGRPATPSSAR